MSNYAPSAVPKSGTKGSLNAAPAASVGRPPRRGARSEVVRGRRIGGRRFLVVKAATGPEYGLLVHDPAVWVSVLDGLDRLLPE
jgi:hypothetical protein